MNHLAAEWEMVGGRGAGRSDLVDDSVCGVITSIPGRLQNKQEVTDGAALPLSLFLLLLFTFFLLDLSVVCLLQRQSDAGAPTGWKQLVFPFLVCLIMNW